MSDTLVLQSARTPLPHPWLADCLASVRDWAAQSGFDYRFVGDELFEAVDADLLARTRSQPVIATDLARLSLLRAALARGYRRALWLDADFLIFAPDAFTLPASDHAVGREIWVQHDQRGRLRAHVQVHNAFLLATTGNSFLDFYADTAARLLRASTGPLPPQFIGPKLLTALHNVVQLPVMERAALFSPAVITDLLAGGGPAQDLFARRSTEPPAGANLCCSSVTRGALDDDRMSALIARLLAAGHA